MLFICVIYFSLILTVSFYLLSINTLLGVMVWSFGFGAASAYIVHNKQRSLPGWFLIGAFTGFLGIAFAAVVGIKPKDQV